MPDRNDAKKPEDFSPEAFALFDRYVHGLIDRREFLAAASRLALGTLTAAGLLDALNPRFAEAQKVKPGDPRLDAKTVEIDSPQGYGRVKAYRVQPARPASRLPVVLVVHENRGLNPHIEDIARRLALEGYIALAPDALSPLGGYPGGEDEARALFRQLDQAKTREDMAAAAGHARALPGSNGRLGVVGFCYGGAMAGYLAVRLPDLDAAVSFYGTAPDPADAPRIKAPLLLHFAEDDERVNAAWPPFEKALKAAGADYRAYVYPGAKHGFNNDTTPRFDQAAAALAWKRTLDFFGERLRA